MYHAKPPPPPPPFGLNHDLKKGELRALQDKLWLIKGGDLERYRQNKKKQQIKKKYCDQLKFIVPTLDLYNGDLDSFFNASAAGIYYCDCG